MIDDLRIAFTEDHRRLEKDVARFAAERIEPVERKGGGEDVLARRYVALLAREGLLRHIFPQKLHGDDVRFDVRAISIVREALARASGFADVMFVMQGLGSAPIALHGSPQQREHWLPQVVAGKKIAAFALTEPDAGSDVASLATTARRAGKGYVLDGTKTFISNAGVADFYTVFAKTDAAAGSRGITCFLVDADSEGLEVIERQEVIAPHPIGTLRFRKCRVADSARIGEVNDGFKVAMRTLDVFRPTVGAAAIGMARRALAEALARVKERRQFGQPLASFQAIQFHLARMATELDAARLLVYRAVAAMDERGEAVSTYSSMAKLFATEAAQRIIDTAVQLFGGQGVLKGSIVERLYREVRALRIYEGTSEIQHLVIASRMIKDPNPSY
jgi:acyl-CoA dehydrogenase